MGLLRNFFLLLLARFPHDFPASPLEALSRVCGEGENADSYAVHLALPLKGTPDQVATEIALGDPRGELFALQARLSDELDDDGRQLILQLARLF